MAHILIVDDETDVVRMVTRLLDEQGHDVTSTRTGEQALELLEHEKFDLVIVDRDLPQLSGRELCNRIRNRPDTRHTPIMMMTAVHVSLQDARKAAQTNADGFLFKPFMAETLLSNVGRLLRKR